MKKLSVAVSLLFLLNIGQAVQSQTIGNQLQVSGELAIPTEAYRPGWGGQLKALFRLGTSEQITFSAGYSRFGASGKGVDGKRNNLHLVPFLAGYRQNFDRLFVEAQAGYGEMGGRIDVGGAYAKPSVGAFIWALNAGYKLRRFDIGLRYQGAHGAEGIEGGTWYNAQFKYLGIFVALNLVGN